MSHSKKFDMVKYYYNTIFQGKRMWDEDRVRNAVEKNMITAEEFEEIVGKPYDAEA